MDKHLVQCRSKNGRTPCHTACLHGNFEILKLILEKNFDCINQLINARDSCGSTPLMEAAIADHVDIVKYLLKIECIDHYQRDNLGNSCLHLSAQSGSLKSFSYFIDTFLNEDQKSEMIEKFSMHMNNYSMTPLHSAVKVLIKFFYLI